MESASKEEAATKARDIYLSIVAKGWSTTLAELAPQPETPVNVTEGNPTVGEFLAEVERTSTLKPKTFHRYAQYFRMMAAQIQGVKSDRSRYNYRTGGLTNWHERVDAIPLAAITPAAVADWKIAYLKRAGSDPRRRLEVSRSFNSALRHCKSLFSAQIINQPNFGVKIPRFKVRDGQLGERDAYSARVTDTALGTIRSLEATVQGFEERAAKLETDIADAQKRGKELETKVGAPFEHEERYQHLSRRQSEIEEKAGPHQESSSQPG